MNDVVIKIENLQKSFGDLVVFDGLNLDVKKGEKIAIIGGSGCGKSVLLRSIEMLTKPDAGTIHIYDDEITAKGANVDMIRRKMGMVYQQFNLFSHMNVIDNLCFAPTKLLKMDRAKAEEKAKELLSEVGLSGRELAWPKNLSGGQKQRVAIARCLMMDPQIMLFDEPTSALDPTMVGEVLATIRTLGKKGLTMLVVTHEMNFAKDFADRILFLADHNIYEDGTPDQIFNNPKGEKTIAFIKKLKNFSYHIDSKNYDLMKLQGEIKLFCDRYGIETLKTWRLELCVEEFIEALLKTQGNNVDIDVLVEYSELIKGVSIMFSWVGSGEHILDDDTNLGIAILRRMSKERKVEKNGDRNQITLQLA